MNKTENQFSLKEALKYFILFTIIFLCSIFIHEVGHGFANSLRGVECSTGFNRVGDIYRVPTDVNFREKYSLVTDSLFDFGVPSTWLLAIIGTIIYRRTKNYKVQQIALGFACTNSVMRFIPCLFVIMTPLLTGKIHIEDEYEFGTVLVNDTGSTWFQYVPACISIVLSVVCMIFVFTKAKKYLKIKQMITYSLCLLFAFDLSMVICNYLDNICRINWQAL